MPDYEQSEGDFNRSIQIIKEALPYLGYQAQKSLQVLVQVEELFASINKQDDPSELSACGLNGGSVDIESMLLHIKDFCTTAEKEIINSVLNFIQMFRMFQKYREFMETMPSTEGTETGEEGNIMMDFLMSQLPPEQKDNFENLRMMMSVMNMS